MGLAASQARLLTLQSRMNDLELRCMQLSNQQIVNSIKSSNLSIEYNQKLQAANEIEAGYKITNEVTSAGSSSTTTNTLKYNNNGTYVDVNYKMLKEMGYDIAPAGTMATETETKNIGDWKMPTTLTEFADLMKANGCADVYAEATNTLNMTKYLDDKGNIVQGGNANSLNYWAGKFASGVDSKTAKDAPITFDEAKLTQLLGSSPSDGKLPAETIVKYAYETNDVIKDAKTNPQALVEGIKNGSIVIFRKAEQVTLDQVGLKNVEAVSGTTNWSETSFTKTLDTSARDKERDAAETWYKKELNILTSEDKKVELQLKAANTEYQAASTEYESVKTLISNNTERGFSIWS